MSLSPCLCQLLHAFSFVAGRCSLRHGLGSAQAPKCNKEEMSETVPQICLDALSPSIEHTQRFQCTVLVGVVVLTEHTSNTNFRYMRTNRMVTSMVAFETGAPNENLDRVGSHGHGPMRSLMLEPKKVSLCISVGVQLGTS